MLREREGRREGGQGAGGQGGRLKQTGREVKTTRTRARARTRIHARTRTRTRTRTSTSIRARRRIPYQRKVLELGLEGCALTAPVRSKNKMCYGHVAI